MDHVLVRGEAGTVRFQEIVFRKWGPPSPTDPNPYPEHSAFVEYSLFAIFSMV
jgi:hypothetical protein